MWQVLFLELDAKKDAGWILNFDLIWIVELTLYLELSNLQRWNIEEVKIAAFWNFFFAATLWKSNSEKTKHGQMLGREKYFARNTTSSQRKRSCAAKYNWRACLPLRKEFNVPHNRRRYQELILKMEVRSSQTGVFWQRFDEIWSEVREHQYF